MPLFKCEKCGCVENTATSNYWSRYTVGEANGPALCSECDPSIGEWHDTFPKRSAKGYLIGSDGYLYTKKQVESGQLEWRERNQGFHIIGPA